MFGFLKSGRFWSGVAVGMALVVGILLVPVGQDDAPQPAFKHDLHTGFLPSMGDGEYLVWGLTPLYDTRTGRPIYVVQAWREGVRAAGLTVYTIPRANVVGLPKLPGVPGTSRLMNVVVADGTMTINGVSPPIQ